VKTNNKNRKERGVALLIALFALLLLSAIGLAMMYSSTTETSVNANFRDKQSAAYASLSGALEARDRIQPTTGDIPSPADIPSTSAANVIYIINPNAGETVAPWNYRNKYADTELCQENILGLSGTAGVPCTGSSALPSGSSWYTTKDNSSAGSFGTGFAAYQQSTPMSYKWTRITLKTDNMTPVPGAATGRQVCWDGTNEVVQPVGASSSCAPTGSVTAINLTSAGNGYNATPHINIDAPPSGGTQATAVANMTPEPSDGIASGTITNAGANYTSIPTVILTGGGGTGAAAVATISAPGAPVTSVSLSSAGTGCYLTAPTVSFSGGGGTGASATATLASTPTCIYSWSATGSCSSYKGTTQTVGAAGGSGFSGSITFKNGTGSVTGTPTVTAPGTGYSSNPTALTGLSGCTPTTGWVLGYHINSLTLTSGGSGYSSAPTVNIQVPNAGTTPTGTATLGAQPANAGQVTGLTITAAGSGYTSAPTVSFSGGGGTGATGIVSLGTKNVITSITITSGGSGYTTAPNVTFNGGGGSGATATSAISAGTYYGKVYLVTSFAQTTSGSKAMTQMEVASAVSSFSLLTGALTLAGPAPVYSTPNSNNFQVLGADANSCGETAKSAKPSIGVYDDPNNPSHNPSNPSQLETAVQMVISDLGKPSNYIGAKPAPDVENVYGALGNEMSTVTGMEALANAIAGMTGANTYNPASGSATSSINMGTSNVPVVDVVNGDLTLSGNNHGYGILLVRGTLTFSGNTSWNGPIFVIGQGIFNSNGGGNGQMTGMIWVAKTKDSSGNLLSALGAPSLSWNGGGGNGIQYDHCWADNMVAKIPFTPPPPTTPLKILSTRTVTY
jgi:hypothetical protein